MQKEIVARERERKARTTLLMALPEDHLAKFHKMTDAKEMWDAIKSRFGGNDESKKMQKVYLEAKFEGFSVSQHRRASQRRKHQLSTNEVSTAYSVPIFLVKTQSMNNLHHTHFLLINQVALNWIMRLGTDDEDDLKEWT
ncbi:hypothetical protein Tco_0423994 [Tanacetum coccineum]